MNLIYLVVEGITDVALYRAFLTRCLSFKELTPEEEKKIRKTLKDWKNFFGNILPLERVRMLRQNEEEFICIIHGAGGFPNLKQKAQNLRNLIKEKERDLKSLLDDFIEEIQILLIADRDTPWEESSPLEIKDISLKIFFLNQPLPEELILNCIELDISDPCFRQIINSFKELKAQWKKLKDALNKEKCNLSSNKEKEKQKENLLKRKVNLLKSLVGERCHDHLLEILLHNVCCEELRKQLKKIIKNF